MKFSAERKIDSGVTAPNYLVRFLRFSYGILFSVAAITVAILSMPVYLYRFCVILLAKIFRPDLGDILNPLSSVIVQDLFTKKHPRSNIIICTAIGGKVTEEEVRQRVRDNWLYVIDKQNGKLMFPKFQQYPIQWMGYTFYKHAFDTFSMDNHIYLHKDIGGDEHPASEEDIRNLTEHLVNAPYKPNCSPWEIHIVHNYVNPKVSPDEKELTVMLFKSHHSLGDGFSLLRLGFEGFFGYALKDLKIPQPKMPRKRFVETLKFLLTLPVHGFYQTSILWSQRIRPSPWKVTDEQKQWHQHYARTDLIPLQKIHDIKNKFEVTFTSVLISAASAAFHQTLERIKKQGKLTAPDEGSIFCMCPFPIPKHNMSLTNHLTANMFDIPTTKFESPLDRLRNCHSLLEASRSSVMPFLFHYIGILTGCHISAVTRIVCKSRFFSTSLSNFPGMPEPIEFDVGRKLVTLDFVVGALQGSSGIGTRILRYGDFIRVCFVAEKALMSKEEIAEFATLFYDEINILYKTAKLK